MLLHRSKYAAKVYIIGSIRRGDAANIFREVRPLAFIYSELTCSATANLIKILRDSKACSKPNRTSHPNVCSIFHHTSHSNTCSTSNRISHRMRVRYLIAYYIRTCVRSLIIRHTRIHVQHITAHCIKYVFDIQSHVTLECVTHAAHTHIYTFIITHAYLKIQTMLQTHHQDNHKALCKISCSVTNRRVQIDQQGHCPRLLV